jgi:hypothetical protein
MRWSGVGAFLRGRVGAGLFLFDLGPSQVGSLAGAAHLLKDNAGVQRRAQVGQKPTVEDKAKSLLDERFSVLTFAAKACPNDPLVNEAGATPYLATVCN